MTMTRAVRVRVRVCRSLDRHDPILKQPHSAHPDFNSYDNAALSAGLSSWCRWPLRWPLLAMPLPSPLPFPCCDPAFSAYPLHCLSHVVRLSGTSSRTCTTSPRGPGHPTWRTLSETLCPSPPPPPSHSQVLVLCFQVGLNRAEQCARPSSSRATRTLGCMTSTAAT